MHLTSLNHGTESCGATTRNCNDQYFFVFKCAEPETWDYYYYLLINQIEIVLTACLTNIKLPSPYLCIEVSLQYLVVNT